MKRPKSAHLLSRVTTVFDPLEFEYHRSIIHNRFGGTEDHEPNPLIAETISRGPSYLNGSSLFKPSIDPKTSRLGALKRLNMNSYKGVHRRLERMRQQSHQIESVLGQQPTSSKIPNAKLLISQINRALSRKRSQPQQSRPLTSKPWPMGISFEPPGHSMFFR
jgi:hypothetical protein